VEVPVFDELEVWRESEYQTFEVLVEGNGNGELLAQMCDDRKLGFEDWSTVRWICAQCSRSNPGLHKCHPPETGDSLKNYAIAAARQKDAEAVLNEWTKETGARCVQIRPVTLGR
jgi:hypothetical protein